MGLRDRIKAQQELAAAGPTVNDGGQALPTIAPTIAPAESTPLLSIREKIKNFGVNRPEESAALPAAELPVAALPAAELPVAAPAEPAKRGRPKKIEPAAETPANAPKAGYLLCVDCFPTVPYVLLSDLVAPLAREIEASAKVAHYRLIDYKAGGLLASALRARLLAEPLTGIVVTTKATFEGRETLSVLEEFAAGKFYGVS